MTNDRTLVIVGCGAAKRDSEAPAKDLYTSTYFQKKRAYAETIGDDWQILSAEHGLVPADVVIKPYETHIDDLDDRELDLLAHSVGMDLINTCVFEEFDEVRVLAGRSYLDPLREREAFATASATVRFPLQEADCGGIGEQMQWLDERVAAYGEQQRLVTDGGTCSSDMERRVRCPCGFRTGWFDPEAANAKAAEHAHEYDDCHLNEMEYKEREKEGTNYSDVDLGPPVECDQCGSDNVAGQVHCAVCGGLVSNV
jgi:hypothetical protein